MIWNYNELKRRGRLVSLYTMFWNLVILVIIKQVIMAKLHRLSRNKGAL